MHEVREIETWILRLLSAPVPVPGKTRVEVCYYFITSMLWVKGCYSYSVHLYPLKNYLIPGPLDSCDLIISC